MRKKIGTVIDEELLRRAKIRAASDSMPLSKVLESALRDYLDRPQGPRSQRVAASTWGVMQASASLVGTVMEEPGVFDA